MKKNIRKSASQSFIANQSIRRDWGEISPITKVIGDKRKIKKDKIARKMMKEAI